nr:SURF1 family protein [Rhabdothermincola salaria]
MSHLFVAACVVAMVAAGIWQLDRLDERRAANRLVVAAQEERPAPVTELVPEGTSASADDVDAVQYRTATVTGTYLVDGQVLVRNRTYEGAPGYWVLTPLVQADGTAVVVNRGWVPFDVQPDGPWDRFAPPAGPVTVTGLVRPPQVRDTGGIVSSPEDPAEGVLRTLSRVDVARLDQQVDVALLPLYLDLRAQEPPQPESVPVPVPAPQLDEGPHLGYAGQWFIFAALTVVVYPLLLRRVARNRAAARRSEDDTDPGDDGGPGGHGPGGDPTPGASPVAAAVDHARPVAGAAPTAAGARRAGPAG